MNYFLVNIFIFFKASIFMVWVFKAYKIMDVKWFPHFVKSMSLKVHDRLTVLWICVLCACVPVQID
jgi:hypothetical protein